MFFALKSIFCNPNERKLHNKYLLMSEESHCHFYIFQLKRKHFNIKERKELKTKFRKIKADL